MNTQTATLSPVGGHLRKWRSARRMSQLDLALDADLSARHLSFVETGRANPSREMLLRLGDALDIPLREQNTILESAGFAAEFAERPLDDQAMAQVNRAIDLMLKKQEPYPAFVMDRLWNMVRANDAAQRLMMGFIDVEAVMARAEPPNGLKIMFDPILFKPYIKDWERAAAHTLMRARREYVGGVPDAAMEKLIAECLDFPGVPQHFKAPDFEADAPPVMEFTLEKDGFRQSWFTAMTSFGTPQDVTVQELKIEAFFPADQETEDLAINAAEAAAENAAAS